MPQGSDAVSCEETAGFLFKHACGNDSAEVCADCDKPVCGKHLRQIREVGLCVSCAKLELERKQVNDPKSRLRRRAPRGKGRQTRVHRDFRDDDPYFYGMVWYEDWGSYGRNRWGHDHYREGHSHDAADFTEADGEAFQLVEDEEFEQDMGAS
jgi:hypothetical protein